MLRKDEAIRIHPLYYVYYFNSSNETASVENKGLDGTTYPDKKVAQFVKALP